MSDRSIDISKQKFGRLTVIERTAPPERFMCAWYKSSVWWLCECECGRQKKVIGTHLRSGHTQSCKCIVSNDGLDAWTSPYLLGCVSRLLTGRIPQLSSTDAA